MNGFERFSQREKKEEKGKDLLTWLSVGEIFFSKMKLNSAFAEHLTSQKLKQNTFFFLEENTVFLWIIVRNS